MTDKEIVLKLISAGYEQVSPKPGFLMFGIETKQADETEGLVAEIELKLMEERQFYAEVMRKDFKLVDIMNGRPILRML